MVTEIDPTKPGTTPLINNVVPLPANAAKQRPSEKVISFVKRHPVLTVAGAVAAGAAVSALLPRKTSRRVLGKALDLAEAAGAATVMFGRETGEKAHALGAGTRKQASALANKAEKAGHGAAVRLEKYGLAAVAAASALGRVAARRTGELGDAATEKAAQVGNAASEQSHKVRAIAGNLKKRIRH